MGCAGSKDVAPAAGPPAGAAAAAAGSATGADKADIIAAAKAAPKAEGKLILATMGCCAFSARVMIALEHKGLAFDVEVIPSDKDKQPDWFVKYALARDVPLVVQRDAKGDIVEACPRGDLSDAVLAWLDAAYPEQPLVPEDLKPEIDEWIAFCHDHYWMCIAKTIMCTPLPMQAEWRGKLIEAMGKWNAALQEHNPGLRKGPYLFGDRLTLPDVLIGPFLARVYQLEYFRSWTPDAATLPDAEAYRRGIPDWPAFKAHVWKPEVLRAELRGKVKPMSPVSMTGLQHVALRGIAKAFVADSARLAAGSVSDADWTQLCEDFDLFCELVGDHSRMEEKVFFPRLEKLKPGVTAPAIEEHAHEIPGFNAQAEKVRAVLAAGAEGSGERQAAAAECAKALAQVEVHHEAHLKTEEKALFPVVKGIDPTEHPQLFRDFMAVENEGETGGQRVWLPRVLMALPACHAAQYVLNYWNASNALGEPAIWTDMVDVVKAAVADGKVLTRERVDDMRERIAPLNEAMA